jgi:hypothetical protein
MKKTLKELISEGFVHDEQGNLFYYKNDNKGEMVALYRKDMFGKYEPVWVDRNYEKEGGKRK